MVAFCATSALSYPRLMGLPSLREVEAAPGVNVADPIA